MTAAEVKDQELLKLFQTALWHMDEFAGMAPMKVGIAMRSNIAALQELFRRCQRPPE